MWILGDEKEQLNGSWESLILEAKACKCFFHAEQHKDLAKVIVEVKKDLHQLDELLNGDTTLFQSTTWKVIIQFAFFVSLGSFHNQMEEKSSKLYVMINQNYTFVARSGFTFKTNGFYFYI